MKTIEEYEIEARDDLTCPKIMNGGHKSQPDISGYALRLGSLRAKWAKYLYLEEKEESSKEQDLDKVFIDRFRYYLYDSPYTIDKKDIQFYIRGDEEYTGVSEILKEQKAKVKFISNVLEALNGQSFYLNTAMKHILWKSGETA